MFITIGRLVSNLLHKRAVEAYDRGGDCLLISCLAVSRLDNRYGAKTVAKVAQDVGKTQKTVYRWITAGNTWRGLRKYCRQGQHLPRLQYGYYEAMGKLWHDHEFSPEYAIEQLWTAYETKATVKTMIHFVKSGVQENMGAMAARIKGASDVLGWVLTGYPKFWDNHPIIGMRQDIMKAYKILTDKE